MLKKIYYKYFTTPLKRAKAFSNIHLNKDSILLPSFQFQFARKVNQNKIQVGANSMLGCACIFESDRGEIEIGENTFINGGTQLISRTKISIGSNVTIAWDCTIYDHNSHSLDYLERRKDIERQNQAYRNGQNFIENKNWDSVKSSAIVIEDDVWIGFGCKILKGVRIGRGAIVGAGSVVREDVEPWTVVAGNPAQMIKRLK